MKTLTSITMVLLLGLMYQCLAQTVQKKKNKTTGAITGRITLDGKGIAGTRVSARIYNSRYFGGNASSSATTDVEGKFRISDIAAGLYQLSPNLPAHIVSDLSAKERRIVVNEGETVEGIDFALIRGGVITGRVTDAEGRPIIGEQVKVIPTDRNVERMWESQSMEEFLTDDRGVYRVYGLPADRYKIAIGEDEYGVFESTRGKRVYRRTFHPDVIDETKARLVELAQGAEVSNINITAGKTLDGFAVSGQIVDEETRKPLSGARFGLVLMTDGRAAGFAVGGSPSDSQGNFRIDNVLPGKYAVSITAGKGTEYYGETNAFDVIDQDVTGLEIKALRAGTVAGTIAVEGTEDRAIIAKLLQLRMLLHVRSDRNGFTTVTELAFKPDGSFSAAGVQSGTARVSIDLRWNDSAKFSVLRIERDGVDQTRGFKVNAGEQITGLRVVVGYGTGSLRGALKIENGTLSAGMYVYAQLQRQTVNGPITVRSTQVDSRGKFLIELMPAGNYELVVTLYIPAVSEKPLTVRQAIVISDGVVSEIVVPINLKPTQTPGP